MQPIYAAILSLPLLLPHFVDALTTKATQPPVWRLCEGSQLKGPSFAEVAAGTETANLEKCTKEMSIKELCCFNFAEFETSLTVDATLWSALVQKNTDLFQDDAKSDKSAKVVLVCTNHETPKTGADAQLVETSCLTHEFSVAAIKGPFSSTEGNPVLNARIEFLKEQGISPNRIPMCFKEVGGSVCPGKTPVHLPAAKYFSSSAASSLTQSNSSSLLLTQSASDSRNFLTGRRSLRQERWGGGWFTAVKLAVELAIRTTSR